MHLASFITGTWLAPASALMLLMTTFSLGLAESCNGLIPLRLTSILGEKASARLLLAAFLVSLVIGFARLQLEQAYQISTNLLIAIHVMSTLLVTNKAVSNRDLSRWRMSSRPCWKRARKFT